MKRIISMLIIIGIILGISACGNKPVIQEETTDESVSETQPVTTEQNATELQIEKTDNYFVSETLPSAETGDGVIGLKYYRHRYYSIAAPFIHLVGRETFFEWRDAQPDPDETNVMLMVNFIRDFNISREDFDKANLEYAWRIKYLLNGTPVMNPKDFANQEDEEVYNADIIYTFDNELINEYYLTPDYPYLFKDEYEDAVANGTYQTQTLDFIEVPVEQPMPESMDQEFLKNFLSDESTTLTVTAVPQQTEVTE